MAALAILQADARATARLLAALSGDHEVVVCSSWDALERVLARSEFDGCVVDVDYPNREIASREVEKLKAARPTIAIIASVEARYPLSYYDLGGLGVAGILPADAVPPTVRTVVDQALATSRADGIARTLEGRYASPGPDAVGWAIEHAGPDTNVEKLAAALGHTPRSLRQALEEAGLPGPTRVLLWGRLLLAGARLGRDGRTVEEVAFSLGYATATSLARAMKSQTGLTPREVSELGGMDRVSEALFPDVKRGRSGLGRLGKIASVALVAAMPACATIGLAGPSGVDRDGIDALIDNAPMDRVHFGVLAVDARSGATLYERDSHAWFVPASTQKIPTAAAAWSLLGPDYRFRTEMWAVGALHEGRLDGDLVLVGTGDPSLSRHWWASGRAALDALADSLSAVGVREVTGALVVDVSAWDSTTVLPTREVADLVFDYGASGGAFAIDEGEIEVVARGARWPGDLAALEWSPSGAEGFVLSRVITTPPDSIVRIRPHYLPETRQLVLEGAVAPESLDTLRFAQRDPVRVASAELARALVEEGISVDRGHREAWTQGERIGTGCLAGSIHECASATRLAGLESPPLGELIRVVLEPSSNWVAEQLTLTLGAAHGEEGTLSEGLDVIEEFLTSEVGVDSLDVSARDGSGLSAYDLVTPRAIVQVLRHMAERPDAGAFRAALAEPGEIESTLEDRLGGLEGRVFAKTGTISNVNSLSGYLVRENGQQVIFSILSNGAALGEDVMRSTIDEIVRVMAR